MFFLQSGRSEIQISIISSQTDNNSNKVNDKSPNETDIGRGKNSKDILTNLFVSLNITLGKDMVLKIWISSCLGKGDSGGKGGCFNTSFLLKKKQKMFHEARMPR